MKLHILTQIIEYYHDFVRGYDASVDFPYNHINCGVTDPIGGQEGITIYDENELDPNFYKEELK